jgi:hypothetical protein
MIPVSSAKSIGLDWVFIVAGGVCEKERKSGEVLNVAGLHGSQLSILNRYFDQYGGFNFYFLPFIIWVRFKPLYVCIYFFTFACWLLYVISRIQITPQHLQRR